MLARPPATMVAKTASIILGGCPKHSNRLITLNEYCYVLVLVLVDHKMVFGYGYCRWQNRQWWTNAPRPPAVLMATAVRRSNTDGIAQCGMSRATLEATGCHHRVTTCYVLPQRPPGQQANKQQSTNTPKKVAILMAMEMRRYINARIADGGGPELH
jgi:hypothetical protein